MRRFAIVLLIASVALPAWGGETIPWLRDYNKALAEAGKTSKYVFIDVYADWCTWCHELDRKVYSNPKVISFMKSFVTVKVDSEDRKGGTALAKKFEVDGLPTLLVTDSAGKVIDRIAGFMNSTDLIAELKEVQDLLAREKKEGADLQATFDLANHYIESEMYEDALQRFNQVAGSPNATADQIEKSKFSIALSLYYEGKLDEALEALQLYNQAYKDGSSQEDALLLLSQIYIEKESTKEAIDTLHQFLLKFPNSDKASQARDALASLEKHS